MNINEIIKKYRGLVDILDAEILIASSISKTREFVLSHPEYEIPIKQLNVLNKLLQKRKAGQPIAQLLGHKEFYGLDFIVNKHTLVPRPETELMVDAALKLLSSKLNNYLVVDIGTGSGCIIVSIARNVKYNNDHTAKYLAIDISAEALKVARKNAKSNDVKVKFLHGSLLEPFRKTVSQSTLKNHSLIITANLPYLSKEIYNNAPVDVKKYEPRSALYSAKEGLDHYEKLLKQIRNLSTNNNLSITALLEISPEQKRSIGKLIKSVFPKAEIEFTKDLAGKWRLVKISF